jgi:predicted amidophosphoribosyltransferase
MPATPPTARALDRAAARALDLLAEAAEVLLPVECAVCRAPGTALCRACRLVLRRSCARPFEASSAAPLLDPPLSVVAAGRYAHGLATCLLALKSTGRTDLVPVLAACLATALHAAAPGWPAGPVLLVPVPTSPAALRRRWFDPVRLLLEDCARRGALPAGAVVGAETAGHRGPAGPPRGVHAGRRGPRRPVRRRRRRAHHGGDPRGGGPRAAGRRGRGARGGGARRRAAAGSSAHR